MPDPALPPGVAQQVDVFLSYARSDLATAQPLADALKEEGVEVGMDTTHIVPGENDAQRLDALLIGSAKVVFLATPASVVSSPCLHELDLASRHGKPVVPVLVAEMGKADLPEHLREIQYLRLEAPDLVTRLVTVIRFNLDWERKHAEYERQATRGKRQVITHRRAVQEAQDWLAACPANATPVSEPVRNLIARSQKRLARNTRLALVALFSVLLAVSGGLLKYQAQLTEIAVAQAEAKKERARAEADMAEARASMADIEAQAAQERTARAEADARTAEEREQATQRIADLYRIRAAEVLSQEGENERALSELLAASAELLADPLVTDRMLDDILISFERVLERAYRFRSIELHRDTVVAFGSGPDVYLSHQHSGLRRLDAQGMKHSISFSMGEFVYAILVIPGEEVGQELVFWKSQYGVTIVRGLHYPNMQDAEEIAFIPNLGGADGYRNWETTLLEDGRVLIGQSYQRDQDPDRQQHWDFGTERGAYVFNPASNRLQTLDDIEELTFAQIASLQEGRNPHIDPGLPSDVREIWGCAQDAPGSYRYLLAEAVIAHIWQRSEGRHSYFNCRFTEYTVVVTAENFASSVYRMAYVYAVEIPEGTGDDAQPNARFVHATSLDTGDLEDYDVWDNISVFEDENASLTIVTHSRREVHIREGSQTHVFRLPADVLRIVALGPGRAAVLITDGKPSFSERKLVIINVDSTFSEFLENDRNLQTVPSSLVSETTIDNPVIDSGVCIANKLDRNDQGERIWIQTEWQTASVIPDEIYQAASPLCIHPTIFGNYYVAVGNAVATVEKNGVIMDYTEITSAITGDAPPPPTETPSSFWVTTRSILRIDWFDSRLRVYEVLRSQDPIVDAAISPSGNRVVLATSDGSPSINLSLWSIAAGRLWRDLGWVWRWPGISFPNDDQAIAGDYWDPSSHRLLTLPEARALAQRLLNEN